MIYLDNASTTFPKPDCMIAAMDQYVKEIRASPYRGSHHFTREANLMVFQTRRLLARQLGVKNSHQICFTYNATYAINLLLKGFLKDHDHVIISSFDHNSVLRPLHALKKAQKIDYDIWTCNSLGLFSIQSLENLIRANTKLIFLSTHSNVLGMPIPLQEVSDLLRKKKIALGLDCTQALGHTTLALDDLHVAMAAGTGHKGLFGPPGIGFLYVRDPDQVATLIEGGGGVLSSELDHPELPPAKYEPGTLNFLGLAALLKSMEWLETIDKAPMHSLFFRLKEGLRRIDCLKVYGELESVQQLPLLAFNVSSLSPGDVERYLETKGIIVRAGLHCAPLIHQVIGTYPKGALRVSLSVFNTEEQIDELLHLLTLLSAALRFQ